MITTTTTPIFNPNGCELILCIYLFIFMTRLRDKRSAHKMWTITFFKKKNKPQNKNKKEKKKRNDEKRTHSQM